MIFSGGAEHRSISLSAVKPKGHLENFSAFVRKEADFSLPGAPWGLPHRFPASERANSLRPPRLALRLLLAPRGRLCLGAATDPRTRPPQDGMGHSRHHGSITMDAFFPSTAVSGLCCSCLRDLSSPGGQHGPVCDPQPGERASPQPHGSWHSGRAEPPVLAPSLAGLRRIRHLLLDG